MAVTVNVSKHKNSQSLKYWAHLWCGSSRVILNTKSEHGLIVQHFYYSLTITAGVQMVSELNHEGSIWGPNGKSEQNWRPVGTLKGCWSERFSFFSITEPFERPVLVFVAPEESCECATLGRRSGLHVTITNNHHRVYNSRCGFNI